MKSTKIFLPVIKSYILCVHRFIPCFIERGRKKEYALTLQAVCDPNLVFIDCFVGFAGSVHDARVFRNSDLWHAVIANENAFFPQKEFIIGDKAYPVLSWCLAPYINKCNLTEV